MKTCRVFAVLILMWMSNLTLAYSASADGFTLSGTSFSILNVPGAYSVPGQNSTVARGINDSGEIIGTYETYDPTNGGQQHGFVYENGTFITLDYGANPYLWGVNDSGEIVGSSPTTGGFLYSDGTFTSTTGPDGIALEPRGINNDGQLVGDYVDSSGEHGFFQSANSFTTLNFPGATTTLALAVNDSGEIVGSYTGVYNGIFGEYGFLYSDGIYSTIQCPGSTSGNALGINDSGAIVGDCVLGGHDNGFLYTDGVYTFVDVPLHALNEAIGINDDGQIVGFTGQAVPEPNTFALLILGLASLALWSTKRSRTRFSSRVCPAK